MGLFMKTDNVFFKSKGSYSYVVTVDMDNQMYMVRKYVKTYVKPCDKEQVKGKRQLKIGARYESYIARIIGS